MKASNKYILELDENKDICFENFLIDISDYLNFREKLLLRQTNSQFNLLFPEFKVNLSIKSPKRRNFIDKIPNIAKKFENINKLSIENCSIDMELLNCIEIFISNNKNRIKKIELHNITIDNETILLKFFKIINSIPKIEEISFQNLETNNTLLNYMINEKLNFGFAKHVKQLKINNLNLSEILYLLDIFRRIEEIEIANCEFDDNLSLISDRLVKNIDSYTLRSFNLGYTGLSTPLAINSIKTITSYFSRLEKLSFKGLYFQTETNNYLDLKRLQNLSYLEIINSKNILNTPFFSNLENIKILNLGDSKLNDNDFALLLNSLNGDLKELNLHRCNLNDAFIDLLIKNKSKLQKMQYLNLSFNMSITETGVNKLLQENFQNLKHLDVRNCGVKIFQTRNALLDIVKNKFNKNIEIIDFYFNKLSDTEYPNLIEFILDNLSNNTQILKRNIKIHLKLNRNKNKTSVNKHNDSETLLKKHKITIK